MNIRDLPIPRRASDMIRTCEGYYYTFYLEMIRMSNASFNDYCREYLDLLLQLTKDPGSPNVIRAAIGVVSMDKFGYHNFSDLARVFDRIVPQVDIEYARFTSWCIGRVVHHPDLEKSRFVRHLLTRLLSWTTSTGRRARPLAAVTLLESLSANAGTNVVAYFGQLQSGIWRLVSHSSFQLQRAIAQAINMFTRAIIRYGRTDLQNYMSFFVRLCTKLLCYGDPMREVASLSLFEVLINQCPSYFVSDFIWLYKTIVESSEGQPVLVVGQAYVVLSCLSQVDPKQFMELFAEEHLATTGDVLLEFPFEITRALVMMCKTIPEFMVTKMADLHGYAKALVDEEPDCAFRLLGAMVLSFGEKAIPDDEMLKKLLDIGKMSEAFNVFFVALTSCTSKYGELPQLLSSRIAEELSSGEKILALKLLAKLPLAAIADQDQLFTAMSSLLTDDSDEIRKEVPRALFRIGQNNDTFTEVMIFKKLLESAIFEQSVIVRCSVLETLCENPSEVLANPEFMKFYQIFVNDDSTSVRKLVFVLLAKIAEYNPMSVTSLTRKALLDSFFALRHVPSIRQRSRVVRCLPELIQASKLSIKAYSDGLMDIIMEILKSYNPKAKFEHFLEEDAQTSIMIGVMQSLILLAPLDPKQVAKHGHDIIDLVCGIVLTTEHRLLAQWIFRLLFALLSGSGTDICYRTKTPLILATCSTFLASTHSRKARMTILKVLGAIGCLEVHQRAKAKTTAPPVSLDDELARQFFVPKKDEDGAVDESMLLSDSTSDQYFWTVSAIALLNVFKNDNLKEFYEDAVAALVQVLQYPRMYMLEYYDAFVGRLLDVLERSSDTEIAALLPYFTQLVSNSTHNTSPFLKRALSLISDRFCSALADPFLDLIIAFLTCLRDGFTPYASQTICLLVGILDERKTTDSKTCEKVLQAFTKLSLYASDLAHLMVPQISDAIVTEQTLDEVRINSLKALTEIAESVDLYPYLGPVVRGIYYSVHSPDAATSSAGFRLLHTILKSQGLAFLINAGPLLESLKKAKLDNAELKKLVTEVSKGQWGDSFKPLNMNRKPPPPPQRPNWKPMFSEEAIVARVQTSNIGVGRQMEQWFRSFTLTLMWNSPSAPIRACLTLATSYHPLAQSLLNAAFFSCWKVMTPPAQEEITKFFSEILSSDENYEAVARSILHLMVFMDRIEKPLKIPRQEVVKAAVRYGHLAYALHLMDGSPPEGKGIQPEADVATLIDLLVQLGDWSSALSVWKRSLISVNFSSANRTDVLAKLQLWDQIEPVYRSDFEKKRDYDSFLGLTESLAAMAKWPEMMEYMDFFEELESQQKREVAPLLAEAALHMGQWGKLNECLEYAPDDSSRCGVLNALAALHDHDYERVNTFLEKSFSLLASRPIKFLADNQLICNDTMLISQELVEVGEMVRWVQNQDRKAIEESWAWRLLTAPREFGLWRSVIGNRIRATGVADNYLVRFFELKSPTLGTKLHSDVFDGLFPHFSFETATDVEKLCYVVADWNVGKKDEALSEAVKLTQSLQGDLKLQAQLFCATWLLQKGDDVQYLKQAYSHLEAASKSVSLDTDGSEYDVDTKAIGKGGELIIPSQIRRELVMDIRQLDVLRKWCDVNVSLIQFDIRNKQQYVINGIRALSKCISMWPLFPDVVQLLNLFFENAGNPTIFEETHQCITAIKSKLLLQAAPQIFIQLGEGNGQVTAFLYDLVFDMLRQHYHDLVFSLLVLKFSKNPQRAKSAKDILDRLRESHPKVCKEVKLIRSTLLRAAVTWPEKVLQRITDAFDHYQRRNLDLMVMTLRSILSMVHQPKCEMHEQFIRQYQKNLTMLEQIVKIYTPGNSSCVSQFCQWCKNMQDQLTDEVKKIRTIQLSAVSPELCEKDSFELAVPGTYKPGKPINHIKYFVGQFSVYMSKQQPKDVIVKGEDGMFYQYLLKGHEDLRLDERIMQFFRLINSLMSRDPNLNSSFIQTVSVIPLSMSHGLVQWATGTDTLRAIVEQYRKLHGRDPMAEYSLLDQYGVANFDFLQPIQKMQIIEEIYSGIPDTDIADFFWLKALTSEVWWKQTNEFTTSTAMMSIVGYVIGLGDRHPSNLLINRITGKVVHIDFGDCFDKAALRRFLPEVVPFRLTRMIVKALGPGGVDGLFRSTFVNMSGMLRTNWRVLEMVLSIFVHEPLIDPDAAEDVSARDAEGQSDSLVVPHSVSRVTTGSVVDSGRVYMSESGRGLPSTEEMRVRIHQKLTGADSPTKDKLSIEEQATWLITSATDPYLLSKMYSGWCPFW